MSDGLRHQMQADLSPAIKARDTSRVAVLRTTLAAIANAEAVDPGQPTPRVGLLGDVERRQLTGDDVRRIVIGERDDLLATAAEMDRLGQVASASDLGARAAILDGYLAP
jgi:hypothetical protein